MTTDLASSRHRRRPSISGKASGKKSTVAPMASARQGVPTGPIVIIRRAEPRPTVVFDTYWRFAAERQAIYHHRISGGQLPWTLDSILACYKFTNAYRAADRVSQFLIQQVIYEQPFDAFDTVFRVLLFKIFNKPETWRLLEQTFGPIQHHRFDVERFDRVLSAVLLGGASIYSAAYIMPSGPASIRQPRKHRMHLELLATLLRDGTIKQLTACASMEETYRTLVALPSFGPFLAYQFSTDINYSEHFSFSEMEFVMPGPGARDGLRKCFTDLRDFSEADTIRWVAERQQDEFRARGLNFQSLWGRPLQLIDCQNLFCEVDKYARVAHPEISGHSGRTRIKQRYSAKAPLPKPWFPPKWGINERIAGCANDFLPNHWTLPTVGKTSILGIEH